MFHDSTTGVTLLTGGPKMGKPRLWREGHLWVCAYTRACHPRGYGLSPLHAYQAWIGRTFSPVETWRPERPEPLTPYWQQPLAPTLPTIIDDWSHLRPIVTCAQH